MVTVENHKIFVTFYKPSKPAIYMKAFHFFSTKRNLHSHIVIGYRMEAISLMELVKMGVKLLVTFHRISLMTRSRPFSNITSVTQILIHFCWLMFAGNLNGSFIVVRIEGKSQFTHEEFGIKLIFLAPIQHKNVKRVHWDSSQQHRSSLCEFKVRIMWKLHRKISWIFSSSTCSVWTSYAKWKLRKLAWM